jgi:hypothetical protein
MQWCDLAFADSESRFQALYGVHFGVWQPVMTKSQAQIRKTLPLISGVYCTAQFREY